MIPLHKGGGRCRTGGKRSSAPNAVEKNAPCTFTGWRASCNKLIILTKKKILKMWRAGGESNPSVKYIWSQREYVHLSLVLPDSRRGYGIAFLPMCETHAIPRRSRVCKTDKI